MTIEKLFDKFKKRFTTTFTEEIKAIEPREYVDDEFRDIYQRIGVEVPGEREDGASRRAKGKRRAMDDDDDDDDEEEEEEEEVEAEQEEGPEKAGDEEAEEEDVVAEKDMDEETADDAEENEVPVDAQSDMANDEEYVAKPSVHFRMLTSTLIGTKVWLILTTIIINRSQAQ